ncbi:MAG TPA: type II CAAX endopeptidase family protein [Gemmatimonadaceae bacterium]|nr:type II CAAX endopeptidase family protein [Gemmatimonadaceae bacterium]
MDDRPLIADLFTALALFLAWSVAQDVFIFADLPPVAATLQVLLVGLLFAARYVVPSNDPAQQARRARAPFRPLGAFWPWTIVAGIAAAVALVALTGLVARVLPSSDPPNPQIAAYLAQPYGWLPFVAGAMCVNPLVGEVIFRGWVQGRLTRDIGPEVGVVNAAVLYTIAFFDLPLVPTHLALGLVCGYAVYLTGSVWAAVLTSFLFNAAWVAADGLLPGFDQPAGPFVGASALAWGAGAFVAAAAVLVLAFARLQRVRDAAPPDGGPSEGAPAPD